MSNGFGCVTIAQQMENHERYLRIIYSDKQSSFEEVLEKDDFVSIHDRNIQYLAVKMCKVRNGLSPLLISDIYVSTKIVILTIYVTIFNFPDLLLTLYFYGTESISYLGPIIWDILPVTYNELPN